jgi:hypothetical protein
MKMNNDKDERRGRGGFAEDADEQCYPLRPPRNLGALRVRQWTRA